LTAIGYVLLISMNLCMRVNDCNLLLKISSAYKKYTLMQVNRNNNKNTDNQICIHLVLVCSLSSNIDENNLNSFHLF